MGTDIHIYAERWTGTEWTRIPVEVPSDRNYRAFAVMAGVRNGTGFAGCVTGEPITPISEPRGIPLDTAIIEYESDTDSSDYLWLGDHSISWVLLSELQALDLDAPVTEIGMVSQNTASQLDMTGQLPQEWCGFTTADGWVTRSWQRPLRESAWLIPKILESFQSEPQPEFVRFVFGFDS